MIIYTVTTTEQSSQKLSRTDKLLLTNQIKVRFAGLEPQFSVIELGN